jgi:hypothetical protein
MRYIYCSPFIIRFVRYIESWIVYGISIQYHFCFTTSYLFFINSILFYSKSLYVYSFLFKGLMMTSLLFHSDRNHYNGGHRLYEWLDFIMIVSVVTYSVYYLYNKQTYDLLLMSGVLLCFISVLYIYYYGRIIGRYCGDPTPYVCELYQAIVHIITFVGHIFILYV